MWWKQTHYMSSNAEKWGTQRMGSCGSDPFPVIYAPTFSFHFLELLILLLLSGENRCIYFANRILKDVTVYILRAETLH